MSTAPHKAEGQHSEILAVGNLPPIVSSEVEPEIDLSQGDGEQSIFTQMQEQERTQGPQAQVSSVVSQAKVVTPSSKDEDEDEESSSLGSASPSEDSASPSGASRSDGSPNSDPEFKDSSPATDFESLHSRTSESKHPETLLTLSQNRSSIFFHDYAFSSGAPDITLAIKDPSTDPAFQSEAKSEVTKEEVVPPAPLAPPANPLLNQQTQVGDEPDSLGVQSFSDIMKQLGVDFGAMPEPSQQSQEWAQEEHKEEHKDQKEQREQKEQSEQEEHKEQKEQKKSKRKTPEPAPEGSNSSEPRAETKDHHDHHDGDTQSQSNPKRLRSHPLIQEVKEAEAVTTGKAAPKPNLHT
ncbi:MAG: hypothetical protein M1561_02925 [Gammaproteobacteria bacterium]|nr:hypothetical protein [Gammaproteobacteria bacterium]